MQEWSYVGALPTAQGVLVNLKSVDMQVIVSEIMLPLHFHTRFPINLGINLTPPKNVIIITTRRFCHLHHQHNSLITHITLWLH